MDINSLLIHFEDKPKRVVTQVKVYADSKLERFGIKSVPMDVLALWDTGADCCAVSTRLIEKMDLPSLGVTSVTGYNGTVDADIYGIDIKLPDGNTIDGIRAAKFRASREYDMIIGMNIITLGDFALLREAEGSLFSFKL